ncbi:glutathione s-transferase [Colletotrichum plurivorum]|uniref:Glutathione s-transferase n=1 Tax=Colletotrichum plurivorum TaxID=2175906 RepID=A0A8H6K2C9_9PEZI|nr:glutathione s-transferase [Colletotrichum plurivorum]
MAASLKHQPRIVLYRGFPASSAYIWSPFVTKLETRLRLAGFKYRADQGSFAKAPRGKIPYVEITYEGQQTPVGLGDSAMIARHLVEDGVCEDLNAGLSPAGRAQDACIRALLEDKLYFYQGRERWHDNYDTMVSHVMSSIPWPVRPLIGALAYRGMMRTLHGQGTGRFSSEEIAAFRHDIWADVGALLAEARSKTPPKDGETPFWVLGGAGPSEADATVYGFIASGLLCAAAPDTQKTIRSHPVLVDYAGRIHERYFGDYDCWEAED